MTFPQGALSIAIFLGVENLISSGLWFFTKIHLFLMIINELKAKNVKIIKKTNNTFSDVDALIFFIIKFEISIDF